MFLFYHPWAEAKQTFGDLTSVFLQFITVILGRQSITRNSSFIPNHTRGIISIYLPKLKIYKVIYIE